MARDENTGGIVYSTRHGKMCPLCARPVTSCSCARGKKRGDGGAPAQSVPVDGIARVSRETKGRKGKGVTLVTGVPLRGDELSDLAKALKQRCGSGGTVRDGVIEIQGDHRDTVVAELEGRGFKVKRAGG